MFENVRDPLGITLVSLLPANCFHILWMCEDDVAGMLEGVVNRNQYFPVDSIHTSWQLFSLSHVAYRRKSPVKVENRLLL